MAGDKLVDTNVVSFFLRESRDAERYLPHLEDSALHVSFMSVAELDLWVLRANWSTDRRFRYERFLAGFVVHPSTRNLSQTWASVTAARMRAGRPISTADAWIAATALLHDLPLVTDNLRDFEGIPGLRIVHEPRPA